MRTLHDLCHFIAWAELPKYIVHLNIYRKEVCNKDILGQTCRVGLASPDGASRIIAEGFSEQFFAPGGTRSLGIDEFEEYLAWLMTKASNSDRSTLELLTYDDRSNENAMIQFSSVREAYNWFNRRRSNP